MDEVQAIGVEATIIPGQRAQDVRVDGAGDHRCWRCGSRGLAVAKAGAIIAQRTSSALPTQVECGTCGAQNDLANPRPTH